MESADLLEAYAREQRPAVIHAASNYEAALPALIAARRLGVPFIYEVRGLWEYTAASKRSGWEATERFALDRQLESLTASEADAVLTLTGAMADELVQRGVSCERISLAPNGVDPSVFERRPHNASLAAELGLRPGVFTVGYIGSIVSYEGLEDLLKAFKLLCDAGIDSRLVVVGDGKSLAGLKSLAEKLEVSDRVIFTGRVSHIEVPRYFSILDAIAIPRKPYKVCQLVSPLKPLEAMAMKVPLVVSDVLALAEMIMDGETGLIHKANDPTSLFKSLAQLASSEELRSQLADSAYHHVLEYRTWDTVVGEFSGLYRRLAHVSSQEK
jgi:glycosyltransferase involved in cell wall biosynthesis